MGVVPESLGDCKVISKNDFTPEEFKFLTLKQIKYQDPSGKEHQWETVERNRSAEGADGVAVLAVLCDGSKNGTTRTRTLSYGEEILLVAQYRPPVGKVVLEFPAGLVEAGESPAVAAVRELKEETGYTGEVIQVSPIFYGEPGMSNSSCHLVYAAVDLSKKANENPEPSLDEGEFLQHIKVQYCENFLETLVKLAESRSWVLDAKLYSVAVGLTLGSSAKSEDVAGSEGPASTQRKLADKKEVKVEEEEILELTGHVSHKATKGSRGRGHRGARQQRTPLFFGGAADEDDDDEDDGYEEMEVGPDGVIDLLSALMGGGQGLDMEGSIEELLGQSLNDLAGGMAGLGGMDGLSALFGGLGGDDDDDDSSSGEWVTDNGEDDEDDVSAVERAHQALMKAPRAGHKAGATSRGRRGKAAAKSHVSSILSDPLTLSCGVFLVGCVTVAGFLQLRHWAKSS